jgi:hypothetical protein
MGMFEMSADYVAEWRQKCRELAESKVDGEEVLAAAGFRQGGASANYVASPAEGEKATLVAIGVRNDPVSLEVVDVLQSAAPASA